MQYSTYFGGSQEDGVTGIAVDRLGQAYIAGNTVSPDLRTSARSLQRRFMGGSCTFFPCEDAFVSKLGAAGRFLAGTYLATPANDEADAIAVDRSGNLYLAGSTGSVSIPSSLGTVTSGKHYCSEEGNVLPCQSAYMVELTTWLNHLVYSRMLRGDGLDRVNAAVADANGGVGTVGGYTESADFPTVRPIQSATGGGECSEGKGGSAPCDGFLAAISPYGRTVTFSTYVGVNGQNNVDSVALDRQGAVILTGTTWSGNLTRATDGPPSRTPKILLGRIGNILKQGNPTTVVKPGVRVEVAQRPCGNLRYRVQGAVSCAVETSRYWRETRIPIERRFWSSTGLKRSESAVHPLGTRKPNLMAARTTGRY